MQAVEQKSCDLRSHGTWKDTILSVRVDLRYKQGESIKQLEDTHGGSG